MTRPSLVVVTVALLVLSAVPAVGGAVTADTALAANSPTGNGTDGGAGAMVADAVATEGESLDGTLERGTFASEFDAAGTDRRRAAVIARYHDGAMDRLDGLERQLDGLEAARANGSLSGQPYRSRVQSVRTDAASLERLATRLENASSDIPDATLAEAGVTREELGSLQEQADAIAGDADTRLTDGFGRQFFAEVSTITSDYNEANPDLGAASGLLTGNLVNLHVQHPDGKEIVLSFRITDDNRITELRAGAREGAPIRMETGRATVRHIAGANSPGAAFRRAVENDDVRIHGNGALSGAAWTAINALRGLVG